MPRDAAQTLRLDVADYEEINLGRVIEVPTFSASVSRVKIRSLKNINRRAWQAYLFELTVGNEKVVLSAADIKQCLDAV